MADFELSQFSEALAGAVAKAGERVVAVNGAGRWGISGVIWRTGLVVTAHEGLEGDDEFEVTLATGEAVKGELIGRDPSTDVALLKLQTPEFGDWPAAPAPKTGSIALAVGRGDNSPIAAFGLVSETGPEWRSMRGGLIDQRIYLGLRLSSRGEGGAVIAPDGSLIGLAVTGPRRRALVIPAATVERAVGALGAKGYVARGYLGVSLHPLAGKGEAGGAIVVAIEADSPAAKAGFVIGDIITTWDGEPVNSVYDVSQRLGTDAVGKAVKLGISRGGSPIDITVTIGERPRA